MEYKSNYCNYIDKGVRIKLFDTSEGVYGTAVPCCHMTGSFISDDLKKGQKVTSAKEVFNHKTLLYFREYFKNNEDLPKPCTACINQESKGLDSPRNKINNSDFDGYDINILDVLLGNACNLACPFCSSNASSLIDKLSEKLNIDERPADWKPATKYDIGSTKTPDIVADILSEYKVHTLKLIGGEPFLKENWNKISDVINSDACKDMHLDVTTNGTILNDEIFERMSKTKSAHLRLSVDSIGNNYEFIRWPHRWNKMHKNLDYLRNNKIDNVQISVNNLVNIFNFEFLPEIEEYFYDVKNVVGYSIEIKPSTHLHNYQNLPEYIIDQVRKNVKNDKLKRGLVKGNNNYTKEMIKREFDVLLAQRNMKAEDVIGPMTREWLGL
jgi:MoaA/NifB/PqqE/SkfB family radical SAM enzyme